jgi:hypothetical protein
MKEADVSKIIKDLSGNFAGSNEDQMKSVQLLKGLATSDDPLANKFMQALDKATTKISNDLSRDKKKEAMKVTERRFDLMSGHLGNGITVFNKAREIHGDYERIAHIDPSRKVSWYIDNPPREVVDYVQDIVDGPNMGVSVTQPYNKVFYDENVIEVKNAVRVGNVILEKGDRIKVVEIGSTYPNPTEYNYLTLTKDIDPNDFTMSNQMAWLPLGKYRFTYGQRDSYTLSNGETSITVSDQQLFDWFKKGYFEEF